MKALVDSDTPIFMAAVSSDGQEEWVAKSRLDTTISKIIEDSGCTEYELYVSGGNNFRYDIDPNYKGKRPPSPEHREACRLHLINEWGAIECNGYEADDAVGCEQTKDTIICGIDKDLLMIPGKHYQWPIVRQQKEVRPARFLEVSEEEGIRTFFTQMLVGDTVDNIIGIHMVGPVKAAKILEDCQTEEELYTTVQDVYLGLDREEDFYKNLDLLWIWRCYGMTYNIRRETFINE